MTTIYAVFLCSVVGSQQICQPTAYKADPTQAACEAHKRSMERIVNPGVSVVCMKKSVPTWESVR
jgi:hypothetical protein